jgi:hypothetical protein
VKHPVRGLLLGPLAVPIAYWLGGTALAWVRQDWRFDGSHALRELLAIVGFGLPIAWAAALVWGAPVLCLLHRLGRLRAWSVMIAGALGGTLVAAGLAFFQQGSLFRVQMPLLAGATLGALAGIACWWAGQARRQQAPAPD